MAAKDSRADYEPTTPGWVLRERFLLPLNISQGQLADALGVSRTRVNQVLNGRCVITTEMALRLERALGTRAEFWLEMQMELDLLSTNERLRDELEKIKRLRAPSPEVS